MFPGEIIVWLVCTPAVPHRPSPHTTLWLGTQTNIIVWTSEFEQCIKVQHHNWINW